MAQEKLCVCYIFSACLDTLGEQQERWPFGFTGGNISFAASSLMWHFNTSITFLAKRDLGSIEISPIEEEEEEEEKMMVVRELEPLPKESGTTAMTALHSQHPRHPSHPCHLTSVQPSQQLSLLPWHEYTGTQHCCPLKRITQCLGHRNELLCQGTGREWSWQWWGGF